MNSLKSSSGSPRSIMRYTVEVGDRSGDGHGITETVHVDILNTTPYFIQKALETLKEDTGWYFSSDGYRRTKSIATGYGDYVIPIEMIEELEEYGINLLPVMRLPEDDEVSRYDIQGADHLVEIMLTCAKAKIPGMDFYMGEDESNKLDLGAIGYGLFEH